MGPRGQDNVNQDNGIEQSEHWAELTLASIAEHHLAPDPQNYAIWYEYHRGNDVELTRAIDAAITADGGRFTELTGAILYQRFFTAGRIHQAVHDTAQNMESTIGTILDSISQIGDKTSHYSETLYNFSGALNRNDIGQAEIGQLINQVLSETKAIELQNTAVRAQLKSSTDEIHRLQSTLDEVQRETSTDPISGLANRRHFDLRLPELIKDSAETGEELSVLVIAIDQYNLLLEKMGRAVGDQVLKLVGSVLNDNLKGKDLPARFSPEQFVAALPKTRITNALTVGHIFREQMKLKKLVRKSTGETLGHVTVSIGVAQYRPGEPASQLLNRLASAHELAVRRGGNQIVSEAAIEMVTAAAR